MVTPTGGGQDDIAFRAYVQDFTTEFFDRFDQNVSRMNDAAEQGFNRIDNSIQQSGGSWAVLGGIVGGVAAKVTGLLFNMAQGAIGFAQASIGLTARVDTLGITLNQMGTRAGYSKEQLAEYEEALKSTGITTQAARASLTRMIRANIDLAEASKLARIAQDSAVVAGINSSAAFERLVLGIQKREPELLDELGITLRRSDAYDRLAATLGKTSKQLTEAEQQQAILNDIYRQSEAVAGVYDAAMGSVGKQVTSTARYVEELQLSLGRAFQPAYQAWVTFMQENIKELGEWFKENEEAVADFGEKFGVVFMAILELAGKVIDTIKGIPSAIESAGVGLAKLIAMIAQGREGVEQAEENAQNLGQYFLQALTIIAGGVNVIYQQIAGVVNFISSSVRATVALATGDVEGLQEAIKGMDDAALGTVGLDNIKQQFYDGFQAAGEFFGLIETVDTSNAEQEIEDVASAVVDLSQAMATAENELRSLMQQFQMEIAQDALQEARRAQEEALKIAQRMEDIQRNHNDNIARIIENSKDAKLNTEKQYEETRLDIARDYNRRLQDIQQSFEFEADELARRRDAVALLRLIRQNKRQLEEEEENRDERMEDAEREFEQRLKQIDEQTKKQIEAAEEQRQKAIEQFQRQLDRERELRALHDQWEIEDRQKKYETLVQELVERFVAEEGLTAEHVTRLLQMWADFYEHTMQMDIDYWTWKAEAIKRIQTSPIQPGRSNQGRPGLGGGIIGQGGQVSRLLSAPISINLPMDFGRSGTVPRVPVVNANSGVDRREIIVRVEGTALEPVIQRQLVASLIEVERNRGS